MSLMWKVHFILGVYIENLTEYVVHSPTEVLNLLKVGKRRLVFAETKMNRASSRFASDLIEDSEISCFTQVL